MTTKSVPACGTPSRTLPDFPHSVSHAISCAGGQSLRVFPSLRFGSVCGAHRGEVVG